METSLERKRTDKLIPKGYRFYTMEPEYAVGKSEQNIVKRRAYYIGAYFSSTLALARGGYL